MAIPLVMADLSVTPASNSPAGSESPSNGDDFLRAQGAILRTTNAKGSDIASAATTDIGAATAEFVDVTGTTTITGLGTIAAGIRRTVRFTGILTLTHNATSLILPGSVSITTANGDIAEFRSLGSGNWKCTNYTKISGNATISANIEGNSRNLIVRNDVATPNSKIEITAGGIVLRNTLGDSVLAGSATNIIVDITASGVNGLDTGAEAANTWYYIWVIAADSNPGGAGAGLLSTSSTAPNMPAGYTYKALVGAVRNGAGSNFVLFEQRGRVVKLGQQITIIDGAVTTLAWTAISVTSFFPPTAKVVYINGSEQYGISNRSDGFGGSYFLSSNAGTARTYSVMPTARAAFVTGECFYADSIYYFIVTTPNTLLATGWEY